MEGYKVPVEVKITLYIILGTFLIFLFVGVVARNPMGVAILRAFFCTLLFGGLIYAAIFLVRRYMPDFWEGMHVLQEGVTKVGRSEENDSHMGKNVDYVVADEVADTVPQTRISGERERVVSEEGSEDLEGDLPLPSAQGDAMGERERGEDEAEERADSEDELPTLDSLFEDEEEEAIPAGESGNAGVGKVSSRHMDYISVGNAQIPYEPENLAKAVKKVMRQDEH